MKKIIIVLLSLSICFTINAQQKAGTITYERKVNMRKTLKIQDEQMMAMMPEFRISQHLLLFSDSISVFRLVPEDEAPDPFAGSGGGARMMFRVGGDGGDLFKNFAQEKSIQVTELGGKNFLITDTIKQQPWKLSEETKTILGYTCHKATRKITQPIGMIRISTTNGSTTKDTSSVEKPKTKEVEVVAWFADNIISPAGPESYGLLPGVILQIDVDNGATLFTALEIKKSVDPKELKEPKKGKIISRQDFNKMMTDMMSGGGGFGNTIRITSGG